MSEPQPTIGERPPAIMRAVVNPLLTLLLRTPLHGLISGRLVLLSLTGRTSGRRYTFPVGYGQEGDTLLITTMAGWKKNLAGGAPVEVWLRGRRRAGTAEVVDDEHGVYEGFRRLLPGAPQLAQILGIRLEGGAPNPDDVRRARERGYVLVRVALRS
jgi:hypothetical protein